MTMTPQKKRYESLKKAGRCTQCRKKVVGDGTMCDECNTKRRGPMAARARSRYEERRSKGLCIACGCTNNAKTVRCDKCHAKHSDYRRQWNINRAAAKKEKEQPQEIEQPYQYPGGFRVGDRVRYVDSLRRRYNRHMSIPDGKVGVVIEPPNADYPDDAVEVNFGTIGMGGIDASCLRADGE